MARRASTHEPFTVVLCQRCHDRSTSSIVGLLGETIRRCPHGMLVTSACWSGESSCVAAVFGRGPRIALQPCAVDRVPNAPTVWVGPLTCDDDVKAVCDWIEGGDWDCAGLPVRLRSDLHHVRRSSQLN